MAVKEILREIDSFPPGKQASIAKEIIQRHILDALYQNELLKNTAFIGGTALRLLYNSPRYSEDLDFHAYAPQNIQKWKTTLAAGMKEIGVLATIETALKTWLDNENNQIHVFYLNTYQAEFNSFAPNGLSIRLEIDMTPLPKEKRATKTMHVSTYKIPIPTLELPSLMVGKLCALLNREKSRDWIDYIWYRTHNILPDTDQLNQLAKRQNNPIPEPWTSFLREKIQKTNWQEAKASIKKFLIDSSWENLLNENTLLKLTPPPDFKNFQAESIRNLPDNHPLIKDIHQYCLEGNIEAINLRDNARLSTQPPEQEPENDSWPLPGI
jgi:predicted nucleotidyltransferase component of viral defense system